MDAVFEIKARLPIEDLVRQYCQLTKKGRNFVALCPWHHDTRPSFLISPDKGICYCFPCQKGGDIFSFYQLMEGVDFPQAIKELAERTGIVLEKNSMNAPKKDEKERLRECLECAAQFFAHALSESSSTKEYLSSRGVMQEEVSRYSLGLAPDSFSATYDHLLKKGFSRKEIQASGLGIQKDLNEERMYDRFRSRVMFPIHDVQGRIIGFGGRTLEDGSTTLTTSAKYLNSSESPLYRKSTVLYGLHHALKAMRDRKRVVIVEGYFDVLACHRVGVEEVVASCGTALTEEHARLLKRHVDTVVLCLDQDAAGRSAAERAFCVLSPLDVQVQGIILQDKDPAEAVLASPEEFKRLLTEGAKPYLDIVLNEIGQSDLSIPAVRHAALQRLLPLLQSLSSSTERTHAVRDAAKQLRTTETSLMDDLRTFEGKLSAPKKIAGAIIVSSPYSTADIAIGLLLLYPKHLALLQELIPPEEGFAAQLYSVLKSIAADTKNILASLEGSEELLKHARILQLYCEEQGFTEWSEAIAIREIRRNCHHANSDLLRRKQQEITRQLLEARRLGELTQEALLQTQYQQLIKLAKMAN